MKLARYRDGKDMGWGTVDQERSLLQPIRGRLADWTTAITDGAGEAALTPSGDAVPLASVQLLAPFERGGSIFVIGANYRKHLKDFNLSEPAMPHPFLKPAGALIGARDDIRYSRLSNKLDFEVELVVVFGKPIAANGDPFRSILGYTVGNDVSARDLQPGTPGIGMDLLSAKGLDGTCPVGPWIVTRDEFAEGSPDLSMRTLVNGEVRQDGRTGDMTWKVDELARFVNERCALEPGDIMFTGTPEGVAQGDGRFLAEGDVIESSIEGIGNLVNRVRRPAA